MSKKVIGNKLPKNLKKKWITALRSGEYQQGNAELYNSNNNTFCCLGVLACVAGKDKTQLKGRQYLDSVGLKDLLGPHTTTDGVGETYQYRLTNLNDGTGKSFNYIASYIDRYL